MVRFWMRLVAVAGVLLPVGVSANDTAAELTTGGLQFVTNEAIEMVSEALFISREEIRVVYEFRNTGDTDQNVLVAFPMPDIVPEHYAPVAYPLGPDDNLFEFTTTMDGAPVETTLHEYAFSYGVDRSSYLRDLGLSLVPFTDAARQAADGLDEATTDEMLRLGLLVPDEYDAGQGVERHFWPDWTYRASYTWEGKFPAGKTVTVEHRYKPSVGGTTGISFMGEPSEGFDPGAEYAQKYCIDEDFRSAVRKADKNGDGMTAPFYESWLSYILTTGGNWSGGSIGTFRLVVDKGDPENLVSFCGDDITKTGPTTFEMVKTDYWPQSELDILILERHGEE